METETASLSPAGIRGQVTIWRSGRSRLQIVKMGAVFFPYPAAEPSVSRIAERSLYAETLFLQT